MGQPAGTVTLLFTDIEGSTRLLHELGHERYAQALDLHRRLLRAAFERNRGYEVDYEGDAFFIAFQSAEQAVAAAAEAQRALAEAVWPDGRPIRVRIGLHTGEPLLDPPKYVGLDVHKAARIMAAAHGGQTLLSSETEELVAGSCATRSLSEHRLKDFDEPISLFQLGEDDFPPLKTISNTNLPRPVSRFVGREQERAEVLALLRSNARLVTLTGPGGAGKTRLAIEAAGEVVGDYPAGVFWVGLAVLGDPALVLETVSQTLGAKEELVRHIGQRRMLLLLDNLEQVLEAGPELGRLLEACPNLELLCTSRERLRLAGEREYPVLPLAEAEAVELFATRGQLEADPTVTEICRRLDYLPLAIELAAARVKVLPPKRLLERLEQRLPLLTGGARDAPERQQTLRATIEWSDELLNKDEQRLFRRLSVFAGGSSLDVAEQVVEADLDSLQSLVEKSLVRQTDGRFWMLETIREYASEKLNESGAAEEVRERHARYFRALALEAEPKLRGPEQAVCLERLETEIDNLRAALSWFDSVGATDAVLEVATGLLRFWDIRGHWSEARLWLEPTPAWASVPSGLHSDALKHAAASAVRAGDYERARTYADQALALRPERSDLRRHGALDVLAQVAIAQGDPERALVVLNEGLVVAREAGDAWRTSLGLTNLADVALLMHRWADAEAYAEQALAVTATLDDYGRAGGLYHLALARTHLGRSQAAIQLLVEGAGIVRRLGHREQIADYLEAFAAIELEQGRANCAAKLLGAAEAAMESLDGPYGQAERDLHERTIVAVRARLGEAELAAAWADGRALDSDAALALVVQVHEAREPAASGS
jgi:predicted ATPase/class 3 adenylate cyclase